MLEALDSGRDPEMNDLFEALLPLCRKYTVILQWVPSHCGISGNEEADRLAKRGAEMAQTDRMTTFKEAKTLVKAIQHSRWLQQHPKFERSDPYYQLSRNEQVIIFRLRTGHNRMKHHLFHKFHIGETDQCPCQTGAMTTEHLLEICPLHEGTRRHHWEGGTPLRTKLFGSKEDLQRTAAFVEATGVTF